LKVIENPALQFPSLLLPLALPLPSLPLRYCALIIPFLLCCCSFLGDTRASQVVALTEEVTAVVQNARPERGDKVGVSLLRCIELYCMACFVLHCTVLYYTVLYCNTLHSAVPVLHCTVQSEKLYPVSCSRNQMYPHHFEASLCACCFTLTQSIAINSLQSSCVLCRHLLL
jgi:hypothetical protein